MRPFYKSLALAQAIALSISLINPVLAVRSNSIIIELVSDGANTEIANIVVPVKIQLNMDKDGNITSEDNLSIINNNLDSGIFVSDIDVESMGNWEAVNFDDDFDSKPDNTKEFSLSFNGDKMDSSGDVELTPGNWDIEPNDSLDLEIVAKIPMQTVSDSVDICGINFEFDILDDSELRCPVCRKGVVDLTDHLLSCGHYSCNKHELCEICNTSKCSGYHGDGICGVDLEPGIYDSNNNLLSSYDMSGLDVSKVYSMNDSLESPDSTCNIISTNFNDTTKVIVPSTDKIGEYAFDNCTDLEYVEISDGATSIGRGAFKNCTSLDTIIIPYTVKEFGRGIFKNCTSLDKIIYTGTEEDWDKIIKAPNWAENAGSNEIVYKCSDSGGVHTEADCNKPGHYNCDGDNHSQCALCNGYECSGDHGDGLCNTVITQTLTLKQSTGGLADENADLTLVNNKLVEFPSVETDDGYIFNNWVNDETGEVVDTNTEFTGTEVIRPDFLAIFKTDGAGSITGFTDEYIALDDSKHLENLVIPAQMGNEQITSIPYHAFYQSEIIENLIISEGILHIGNCAFEEASIKKLTLPNSISTIGNLAFGYCSDLTLTNSTLPTGLTFFNTNPFHSTAITEIIIPNNLDSSVFATFSLSQLHKLTSVTIPDHWKEIPAYFLRGNKSLKSVQLPSGLEVINSGAFAETGLKSITIPNTVTSIGNYVFNGCTSLRTINIYKSKNSISGAPWGATNATVNWLG